MLEHDLANRLLDCAEAGDRQGYARERRDMQARHPGRAQSAERLAVMQIRMWRDKRYFGWRKRG